MNQCSQGSKPLFPQPARRIYDELRGIERNSKHAQFAIAEARNDNLAVKKAVDLPDIAIPETELSVREVVGFLEEFLRIQPRRVSGEIIIVPDTAGSASNSHFPGQHLSITMRITRMASDEDLPLQLSEVSPDDPETAIRLSAEMIFHLINPHVLAVYAHDEAIKDYTAVSALEPNDEEAYYNLGIAYFYKGEYDRAIADYDQAIRISPRDPDAYNARGLAYQIKGAYLEGTDQANGDIYLEGIHESNDGIYRDYALTKFDHAIADYTRATDLNPKFIDAFYNRGNAYHDRGDVYRIGCSTHSARSKKDHKRAIADYDKAIALDPKFALAYYNRGFTHTHMPGFGRAMLDYNETISLEPEEPESAPAYNGRGYAYFSKGYLARAIADYNEAIRVDPTYEVAYSNRGFAYYHMKNGLEQAIMDYNEAIRRRPGYAFAYDNRADAYLRKREYDLKVKDYSASKRDYDQAIQDLNTAISIRPNVPSYYFDRGDAYCSNNKRSRAFRDYEEGAKLYQNYIDANLCENDADADADRVYALLLNNFAWRLGTCPDARVRNGRNAVKYAKEACKLTSQKYPSYLDTLAAAYAETGDFDNAIETEEQALKLIGTNTPGYRERLKLYKKRRPYRAAPDNCGGA